jgi:hypothetical protein
LSFSLIYFLDTLDELQTFAGMSIGKARRPVRQNQHRFPGLEYVNAPFASPAIDGARAAGGEVPHAIVCI